MEAHPLEVVVAAIKKRGLSWLIIWASFWATKAHALGLESVKFLLNFFTQDSSSGDQVYDNTGKEDVTAFEPTLFIVANVDEETNIKANFVLDTWTAASDTALDGETGASGGGIKNQSRVAGQLSYIKGDELNGHSYTLGVSSEYDYRSLSLGGSWTRSFAEDNFTFSITPQLFLDQAKDYDLSRSKESDFKGRTIWSMDIAGAQLLSPKDIIQFGYTHIQMNGMMNSIAGTVRVDSEPNDPFGRQSERMPSKRVRHALYTKWLHSLSETSAFHLSYRYYQDDWDLQAHTLEFGPRWSFAEDKYFLMPTLRYYQQTAVDFYSPRFANSQGNMTSDSDLEKFTSIRYGMAFSSDANPIKLFGFQSNMQWSLGAYHTDRSNEMDHQVVQFGIGFSF